MSHIDSRQAKLSLGHRAVGTVVLFTGLSGSGKTTIARAVFSRLEHSGYRVRLLDGDELRRDLCADLQFSKGDRDENARRVAALAGLISAEGVTVLIAMIIPFRAARQALRQRFPKMIEVFVNAPLSVCERRDPKGLYRRARAGEVKHFTGIDDIYEVPAQPDIECHTDSENLDTCVERVLAALRRRPPVHATGSLPDNFSAALRELSQHRVSLKRFATIAKMSTGSATRAVHKEADMSFRQLRRVLLTQRARALLASGMAVKAVAIELGFSCTESLDRFLRPATAERRPEGARNG